MKETEHERRDWIIVFIITLFGLLLVLISGQWALRFVPQWELKTDMGSKLDPSAGYPTDSPVSFVKAIGTGILTQPVWLDTYLTPGAVIPTRIRPGDTPTSTSAPTRLPPTNTELPTSTATSTLVYIPSTRTPTSNPAYTKTPTPVSTSTSLATSTATPTSTRTPISTSTLTNTPTPTNTSTPTPPPSEADLAITIDDTVTAYNANTTSVQYLIIVSNLGGPSGVTGATVNGLFSANLAITSCTGSGGVTCAIDSPVSISSSVNLPVGTSITYTVDASVASASGNLVGTATINPPGIITDPNTSNNTNTDTDFLITEIATNPDGAVYNLPAGVSITLPFNVTVNKHGGYDMVYYELPMGSGIWLDWVTVEISDGITWYTVFNWGDNVRNKNANMDYAILSLTIPDPQEPDQRDILSSDLYLSSTGLQTGVAIDLDAVVPAGSYRYIRFYAPTGDADNKMEIDAIEVITP